MNPKPLERKIEQQKQEIAKMESELLEKKAFLQGLIEAMRLFPKYGGDAKQETVLREGSDMAQAREFLASHGRPAHVTEILKGIGKENTKTHRLSLSSSLASYARKEEIFAKTSPNTFTLIGMEVEHEQNGDPPEDFGATNIHPISTLEEDIPF
jgi:hypothetical protein